LILAVLGYLWWRRRHSRGAADPTSVESTGEPDLDDHGPTEPHPALPVVPVPTIAGDSGYQANGKVDHNGDDPLVAAGQTGHRSPRSKSPDEPPGVPLRQSHSHQTRRHGQSTRTFSISTGVSSRDRAGELGDEGTGHEL
jgi:hypothetical protein